MDSSRQFLCPRPAGGVHLFGVLPFTTWTAADNFYPPAQLGATVKDLMSSATKLVTFTKAELVIVVEFFSRRFGTTCIEYKRSWSKEMIINSISRLLGNDTTVNLSNKRRKVQSLKKMAEKVLRGKSVPKQILNIAYAQYVFPERLKQWQNHSPIGTSTQISTNDNVYDVEWYSFPETNKATENHLYKTLDSHHLLTNLRTRTSTHGLKDISPDAWKRVASSFKTKLTPAMVEDLIDKQSNSFAQTHFSQEVENVMRENGDDKEAELCGLIRGWYQAEDEPALAVSERIERWFALRSYLLKDVKFDVFPPQTQYVKGFSVVAFEGFLTGIDTKLQLFQEIGPYCVRTVSSLPAETAVGGIQDMNINKAMAVKAKDVPKIISSLTEVMTYKCDPDRGFFMKTSRSAAYPVVEGVSENRQASDDDTATCSTMQASKSNDGTIKLKNHPFDKPERRRTKARRRLGELTSDLDAPPKGTLTLRREFFKCNESKILPKQKSAVPLEDNEMLE